MHPSAPRYGTTLPATRADSPQKALVASTIAAALLFLCGWIFWLEDWRYSLPTPRPAGLIQPPFGSVPALSRIVDARGERPTLVHVFNPECPCSRFNVEHVRALAAEYGDRVQVVALLQGDDRDRALERFESLRIPAEPIVDVDGSLAADVGVYSTPQAVILAADGSLYYRGNYNRARYCDDRRTEFARIALDALLAGDALPPLPPEATNAYGCALPGAIEDP
jgi:hypothetical protein